MCLHDLSGVPHIAFKHKRILRVQTWITVVRILCKGQMPLLLSARAREAFVLANDAASLSLGASVFLNPVSGSYFL